MYCSPSWVCSLLTLQWLSRKRKFLSTIDVSLLFIFYQSDFFCSVRMLHLYYGTRPRHKWVLHYYCSLYAKSMDFTIAEHTHTAIIGTIHRIILHSPTFTERRKNIQGEEKYKLFIFVVIQICIADS